MRCITIEFEDAVAASVDDFAAEEYGGDREAAIRAMLTAWLMNQRR